MPRTESRTKTAIWRDREFIALSCRAQRLYWLLYSQPTISLCGVVAYTPGRWARLAPDDDLEQIEGALHELERAKFIVVDYDTEEVFVRSFMRNDGVWNSPKTRAAALTVAGHVMSVPIGAALKREIVALEANPPVKAQVNTP